MNIEIYQVDSFASEPFKGNPAGVCITEEGLTETLMLSIAEEMAVPETAFLSLNDMKLRWFTPKAEVNLCGHGTLAVAHILREREAVKEGDSIDFDTLSGSLTALVKESTIELNFPSTTIESNVTQSPKLLECLGLKEDKILSFGNFDSKTLIEVDSEETLVSLSPNFDALKQLPGCGVLVTTQALGDGLDFISRYFSPWVGVNEDPVTGSAHCALTIYWSEKLKKSKLKGYQASPRGGYVSTELLPNGRIKLVGSAVTTIKGTMQVSAV